MSRIVCVCNGMAPWRWIREAGSRMFCLLTQFSLQSSISTSVVWNFLKKWILSFSLPDVLCDPTDLIWRKGTPFKVMTGRTAPSSDGLLADFSVIFLGWKANARRSVHSPQDHFIITLIISDRCDWRDTRGKWPLASNPNRSSWHRHTSLKLKFEVFTFSIWVRPVPWYNVWVGTMGWERVKAKSGASFILDYYQLKTIFENSIFRTLLSRMETSEFQS